MPSVARLLAAMRQSLPAVPPGAPLCRSCGQAAAAVGDLEPVVCRPCLYRLTSIAAEPRRFEASAIADLWTAHGDVLEYGRVVVDEHVIVAPPFLRLCQHTAPGWIWSPAWPTGEELLTDGIETLEPAPDGSWRQQQGAA